MLSLSRTFVFSRLRLQLRALTFSCEAQCLTPSFPPSHSLSSSYPPPPSFPFRHLLGCTTLHLSWRGFDVRVYVYYYVTYLHTYLSIDLSIRYPGSYIHLSLTVSFSLCIYRINRQHYSPATQARHKTTFSTPPPQLSHPTSPPAHAAAPAPPLPNSEKDPKQCTQES